MAATRIPPNKRLIFGEGFKTRIVPIAPPALLPLLILEDLPKRTAATLSKDLQSWNKLNDRWKASPPNTVEVRQFFTLEWQGAKRPAMLRRIISRYLSTQRRAMFAGLPRHA